MKIIPGNAQHVGRRDEQQDSFGFSDVQDATAVKTAGALAIVADGMGGMAFGKEASQIAQKVFLDRFLDSDADTPPATVLSESLFEANTAVFEMAEKAGVPRLAGTTLVAALVKDGFFYWISVGDSRIYLLRDGKLTQLNEEHNYGNQLLRQAEQGVISQDEAEHHPERHALTSYVGLPELHEIDLPDQPIEVQTGDFIILCSDGLFGTLSDQEILDLIGSDPQLSADDLVEATLSKSHPYQDNVTVAILGIGSAEPSDKTVLPPPIKRSLSGIVLPASIFAVVALVALWFFFLKPPNYKGVYAGDERTDSRTGSKVQDLRGHFITAGVLNEARLIWTTDSGRREDGALIVIGQDSFRVPVPVDILAGIVRREDSELDALVFTALGDTVTQIVTTLSKNSAIPELITLPGSIPELERLGYFYSPTLIEEEWVSPPEDGKLRRVTEFLPKRARLPGWTDHNTFAEMFYSRISPQAVGWPENRLAAPRVTITKNEFDELEGQFKSIELTDNRFVSTPINYGEWTLHIYRFEDVLETRLLVVGAKKDMETRLIIRSETGSADSVCVPSILTGDSPDPNIIRLSTGCTEQKEVSIDTSGLISQLQTETQ